MHCRLCKPAQPLQPSTTISHPTGQRRELNAKCAARHCSPLPTPPPLPTDNNKEPRPYPHTPQTMLPLPSATIPSPTLARILAAARVRLTYVVMWRRAMGLANKPRGFVCLYGGPWVVRMNYGGSFACTKASRVWTKSPRKYMTGRACEHGRVVYEHGHSAVRTRVLGCTNTDTGLYQHGHAAYGRGCACTNVDVRCTDADVWCTNVDARYTNADVGV